MSKKDDERLESMLRSRRMETANSDLVARIILQAQRIPQLQNVSLWDQVRDLFAEFHLPKPAYVLAGALAIGMVVGFSTPSSSPSPQDYNVANTQGFLDADEGLL
jgi:hypothetical protein